MGARGYALHSFRPQLSFFRHHFRLAAAEAELESVMGLLREKQGKLADVEAQIALLQTQYDDSVSEKHKLEKNIGQTAARLKRASKLTTALADEQSRWEISVMVRVSVTVMLVLKRAVRPVF